MVVVVQVQEKMRKDEETLSLEEVQVVQLSVGHIQAAEDKIRKKSTLSLSQKEILIVSKRKQKHLIELQGSIAELERKRAQSAKLREKFKVGIKEVFQPGMLACTRDTCGMFFSRLT